MAPHSQVAVARLCARLGSLAILVLAAGLCASAPGLAEEDSGQSVSVAREISVGDTTAVVDAPQLDAPPVEAPLAEPPSRDFVIEPLNIKAVLDPEPVNPRLKPGEYTVPSEISELIAFLARDYQPLEEDLDLEEAVALALTQNHDLNSARLSAMAACEGIAVNWAALRPQVNMSAKAYWQESNLSNEPITIELPGQEPLVLDFGNSTGQDLQSQLVFSLTQRIYDFGLTNDLIDVAVAQHSIRNYTVDMAEQQLVHDVIVAYYSFNVALAQVRIRLDELDLSREFLRQAEIQYEVGVVPRLDVIRAEARVEQAKSNVASANAAAGNAAAYFFSLLGAEDQRYIPAIVTADLLAVGAEEPQLGDAVYIALDHRPEIELQYSTLFAGEKQQSLARNRPILDAYANAAYFGQSSNFQGTDNYEYGLQLVWPLYTGGKDRAQRRQAELETLAIAEGIFDLEAKIELDVTQAWNRLQAALSISDAARKNLELSGEALRAAAAGYNAGVTPYIEFEDALDKNIAAALGFAVSLGEVKMAQANLVRAQGFPQGYPGDPRARTEDEVSAAAVLGLEAVKEQHPAE